MTTRALAWRRTDAPGLEFCRVAERHATGTMMLREDGAWSAFRWRLAWDESFATREAEVENLEDGAAIALAGDGAGGWSDATGPRPDLQGCRDADLGGSGFTNGLTLRRLGLAAGAAAALPVAWIALPVLAATRVTQGYVCVTREADGSATWRFEDSAGHRYEGLRTDDSGDLLAYPGLLERVEP